MGPPRPFIATSSATSAKVGQEDRPDCLQTEAPCTSARVDEEILLDRSDERETDDGTTGGVPVVPSSDGDDIIEESKSGMKFNSFEDSFSYYKHYGKKCGFGVMTQRSERSENQSVRYVTLGCARGRKARIKSSNLANPCLTGKTDRKASINALRVEEKMWLTTVHNTLNHGLSLMKSRFFRCNREVSESIKRVLDINDLTGIRLNKSYRSLVVGADDDVKLKKIFWADPHSRAAYQYFGDVVTFDTTYLTNRYGMPFAPFVGCMDNITPKAIITDQDKAMKNAIAISFPETRHRLCLWHILKKVPEKLGSYAAYRSGLKIELMKYMYDIQTIEEFEKCWAKFINTYDLNENAWLKSLYAERESWVPVFLKEHFWAGMSTTQRSESMNAFFDSYVHSKTNLKEFVDQFDSVPRKKIENENHAEFQLFSQVIPCVSRSPIEKKFQKLYTKAKFREVQQQVISVLDLDPSLLTSDGVMKSYLVEDEVRIEEFTKMVTYSVDFNEEDCNAKCSYSNEQFEDAKKRIHDMTECYHEQTRNRSLTQTVDTTAAAGSQQVKSPLVVRGK
ncbi:protein FAR-RED ELONGATED HYPOCOTYL 3-like [Juglans microcarpa x Juglans regia]|uniref:protein FAR-RED ELONGATED HYPOCOTYL 3-like n=1 Tax=Juglans microcarpa x Juglans regia TaxID=2249226 RepID=UPI001B7EB1D8|nr:protein FAR-RED ELONGATED HYPOCOTYL 3-like [Juglans microcarpa x Juglans regia]